MPLIDILLPEYDREIATTRALIDAGHELDLTWRPDPRARTLGQLVAHLADIPAWTSIVMTREGYDVTDTTHTRQAGSVATMLEWFDTGASAGRTALVGRIDGELIVDWKLERRGHLVFTLPRVSVFRVLVLNHLIHHRGQLSVYLRMRGARVPSIYGPTADG
ncbi:MAG: DinB family protein [Vicinamibacterales bacterium]